MTHREEAERDAEVAEVKARLRVGLRKSKALIAAYRERLAPVASPEERSAFRFKR